MASFNNIWKKIFSLIKNKYALSLFIFSIWIGIFDSNNVIEQFSNDQAFRQIEKDKKYYQERIKENSKRLNELKTDRENLEKFAREEYLMKKSNEDIFYIERKED